jgi:hypothetical protein
LKVMHFILLLFEKFNNFLQRQPKELKSEILHIYR